MFNGVMPSEPNLNDAAPRLIIRAFGPLREQWGVFEFHSINYKLLDVYPSREEALRHYPQAEIEEVD